MRERLVDALMARSLTFRALMSGSWPFRILMAGSSISMLGSRISTIAFPMLVLHLDKSPVIAGLVTFAVIVPSMLAYIPAGALVDRWDPWRVMVTSEVCRGIAVVALVLSLQLTRGHASLYFLMSVMVAEEILEVFWILADRRYLSQVVEREKIAETQASIEVRAHTAALAGRPIGPFLFMVRLSLPFLADALSFLVSICTLVVIGSWRVPATPSPEVPRRQLRREIGDGFLWLWENLDSGATMLLMSLTTLIAQALILILLSEAHDKKLSTVAIGVVLAASGVGGVAGAAIAKRLPGWTKRFWLQIQLCAWSVALGLLAVSGVRLVWCIAAVMMVLGLTGAIGNIKFGTYLVRNVRGDMLGRVTSIGQVMAIGAMGIGPFLGGAAIQNFGTQVAVELFLDLVLLMTLASLCMPWITRITAGRHAAVLGQASVKSSLGPQGQSEVTGCSR